MTASASRIPVGEQATQSLLQRLSRGRIPPDQYIERRPIPQKKASIDGSQIAGARVNPQELNFNQAPVIESDSYRPGIQSSGDIFAVLSTLLSVVPGGSRLAAEAGKESKLLGATANV